MEMASRYDPKSVESRWYQTWDKRGYFKPRPGRTGQTFTVSMPPPNITGELHMGHAMYTLQDLLIRWHRMLGDESLWVPGTDHAAIATQNVIEKQLAREGTSKEKIGRDAFDRRVQEWYAKTGDTILRQMRYLGFSADWSRIRFTMDPDYVAAIRRVFVDLWKEGLIYRGPRIVNWCPRDLSSISDLEVEYEEADDFLYFLRYPIEGGGSVSVATARPETMVGDTGVAVHPEDPRYRALVGRTVVLPIVQRRVPIVADAAVERDFGTGAVKVTPGHDATDFEIGERQHLEIRNILHPDGRMQIPEVPALDGLPLTEARARIVEMLRAEGALEKIDPYHHSVGHCDRCGAVIEPLVSDQWWVKMKPLAGPAIAVAEGGEIGFHPDRWKEQYLRWMRNIRDWNISRQIWLGHRIPVWTCANGHQLAYLTDPTACSQCGDRQLTQDPDVLDTWFSSALWPFVTLGWPKDADDLRRYYPTQVLDTGRDILYLWVARMIFMSLHFTKKIPFSEVLIHGNVLDGEGRRMSKSLGNGVDPLVMIDRYGADATRAWCVYNGTTGQDIRFFEDKIKGYQFFANKLWNAARLVLSKLPPAPLPALEVARLEPADRWILGRLSQLTAQVTGAFQQFEFGPAVQGIYDFVWHEFADDYLELIKARSDAMGLSVAARVLEQTLRLLHPIMPFITEELWQRLPHQGRPSCTRPGPEPERGLEDEGVLAEMAHLLDVVQKIRNLRQESAAGLGRARASLTSTHPLLGQPVGQRYVATLAQLDLDGTGTLKADQRIVVGETQVAIELPQASGPQERARLARELEQQEREIDGLRLKLQNPGFTSKAPKNVIEKERARLAGAEAATERLRRLLDELR